MQFRFSAALVAILAPLAVGQTVTTFPGDFANVPGDSYQTYLPLAYGISRTQFLYESWQLPITNNRPITRVGFRQDGNTASTGKSIQLSIYMGSSTFSAATVTSNFANNYNGAQPRTLVFGPAIVALPSFTTQTTEQELWINLTTPHTFHTNENLIVEYVVTANNNANLSFPYYLDEGTYVSTTANFGAGCQSSAGQTPTLAVGAYAYLGGNLSYSMSRAPASSLVWLNIDFTPIAPIDMGPFGAPGCTLLVNPRVALASQGTASGTANWNFTLPTDRLFFHANIYAQALIFDLFANNLGFVTSNGTSIRVGMYPPAAEIYTNSSATATTGGVNRNAVPISKFQWN